MKLSALPFPFETMKTDLTQVLKRLDEQFWRTNPEEPSFGRFEPGSMCDLLACVLGAGFKVVSPDIYAHPSYPGFNVMIEIAPRSLFVWVLMFKNP